VRGEAAKPCFESVKKSILELLTYAQKTKVRLGIENRYHYMEFPSPDELEILLGLADPDQIGFIYDVGHAQTLDLLGFYPHEEWLNRFGPRIIGTHLHDVLGTTDHYAPGLGNVDFDMVAAYLPENAFRTCEFQTFNTPEQVKTGLKMLVEHGCIKLQN
jgi:sugar phosphate isomerase/epimerase